MQASSTSTKGPDGFFCRETLVSEYERPHSVAMNIAVAAQRMHAPPAALDWLAWMKCSRNDLSYHKFLARSAHC